MKRYVYDVNGRQFEDNKAFGEAWQKAREMAMAEHCGIRRTDIAGDTIKYLVYVKAGEGGTFLDERYCDPRDMKIF